MRIVVLTECPYSGVLRVTLNQVHLLKKLEPSLEIVFILPEKERARYGESQKDAVRIFSKFGEVEYASMSGRLRDLRKDADSLGKILETMQSSAVISYSKYAGKLMARLHKNNLSYKWFHAFCSFDYKRLASFALRNIERLSYGRISNSADGIILLSESELKESLAYCPKARQRFLIPNLLSFESNNTKAPLSIKADRDIVILSRISRDKGIDRALKSCRKAGVLDRICIAGEGPDLIKLKAQYPEVLWRGRVGREEVPGLMNSATFYISGSIVDSTPFSLLECMREGTTPILSDIGAHRDLVLEGVSGWFFKKDSDLIRIMSSLEDYKIDRGALMVANSNILQLMGLRGEKETGRLLDLIKR
jgi:glycosyltransferase involved in cell wall biosynthesis